MTKTMTTENGYEFLIDDEDFEYVNRFRWFGSRGPRNVYIRRYFGGNGQEILHRKLMNAQKGDEVDHINNTSTDNRKCNLRIVSHAQNCYNRRPNKTNRGMRGVYMIREGRWRAMIKFLNNQIHVGYFKTAEKAALAWNEKAIELFGEFAYQNKIEDSKCR